MSWIDASIRKPILIRGTRQVGKSTLVRLFAERSGRKPHEVDLERYPELDEIQAVPSAIAALRSLHEDRPDLPVIAAGSLLEFVLADHAFSIPVGRIEYLFLEPMGCEGFLAALNETALLDLVSARQYDRALRFDTNPPLLQHVSHTRSHGDDVVEFTLLSLPLCMVEQASRLWQDLTSDRAS